MLGAQCPKGAIMKIPRITILTLGVASLDKATKFYEAVLGIPPNTSSDGITFLSVFMIFRPTQLFYLAVRITSMDKKLFA